MPVNPPSRQKRSTHEHDGINSSPPPPLKPNNLDEAVNGQLDEVGHEPLESPVKPDSPVQASGEYENGECTLSPQDHPRGLPFRARRPHPLLGSPFRFVPRQVEKGLESNESDWSSDYGSPQDTATHYLPTAVNDDDELGGPSPYRHTQEHYSLSMVKNQLDFRRPRTPITMLSAEVTKGWPSLCHATTPDRDPFSTAENGQAIRNAHTPTSGYSSPYVDEPKHLPLGYVPNYGAEHQSELREPHVPHYGSKLRYTLRSSSPHQDDDFAARDEWNELPIRGRTSSPSASTKYALVEDSSPPPPKVCRSRKSRMTSYGHVGGSRVFTGAFKDLIDDEEEVLERARKMPLPESPAEEDAPDGVATGFAPQHDPNVWNHEAEKSQNRPLQSRASRSAYHFSGETVRNKAPRSTRDLSGATIVPSVEGKPQLVNEEPVLLVEYEVPASYQFEQQAECPCKSNVPDKVVLPCAGTESYTSRVARLEQQSERLAKEVETLKEENNHLRLLAVGASCLLIGGALVLAKPGRL